MEYLRRAVEEIVLQSEKAFKCILVTGAKQTGKSTMLKYVPMDGPFIEENGILYPVEIKKGASVSAD